MSRRETPMTVWFWEKTGGTLIEEYPAVERAADQGQRLIDGVILVGEEKRRLRPGTRVDLRGKDVIVVQAKNSRLGMYLMGQTLFSAQLIKRLHQARSVESVALVAKSDAVLQRLLEEYGCKVVVCPAEVCRLAPEPSGPDK